MLADFPLLSMMIFLPLTGALFLLLIQGEEGRVAHNSRMVALWVSFLTFLLSLILIFNYTPEGGSFQYVEHSLWIPKLGIHYHLGVDGISLPFICLSTFLTVLCFLFSWGTIQQHVRSYMVGFLFLETCVLGAFCSLDLVLFYVFYEGVLIPLFLIIGIWGGITRIYSCFKFFLYTLFGSILMLIAIIGILRIVGTTDLEKIAMYPFSVPLQKWLWIGFFMSFAIKIPMWPFHTWLPDAHVEAPTAGSALLAGVLLKMGGYGFLRFSLPLFPQASMEFAPFVLILSVIGILYTSLIALVQKDMKKLIAYSSIAHMGFVTLGIFSLTEQSLSGALIQMLNHGFVSAALFFCVGMLYERTHIRDIAYYGGLAKTMPFFSVLFMIFTLSSLGLPGTGGFVGEILILIGSYQRSPVLVSLATGGIVLAASYGLWFYRRLIFGAMTNTRLQVLSPLTYKERFILTSLAFLTLWIGIYPSFFIETITPSVEQLMKHHHNKINSPFALKLTGENPRNKNK